MKHSFSLRDDLARASKANQEELDLRIAIKKGMLRRYAEAEKVLFILDQHLPDKFNFIGFQFWPAYLSMVLKIVATDLTPTEFELFREGLKEIPGMVIYDLIPIQEGNQQLYLQYRGRLQSISLEIRLSGLPPCTIGYTEAPEFVKTVTHIKCGDYERTF